MQVLVVSCYELGHQPLAAASVLGFLGRAGFASAAVDLSVEPESELDHRVTASRPRLVLLSVPMHTALHTGVRAARRLRQLVPAAHLCFFGLYASLNARHLFTAGLADSVIAGEAEATAVGLAQALVTSTPLSDLAGLGLPRRPARPVLQRLDFAPPARDGLPPVGRYAQLVIDGERRPAAAIESSRGCLHHCRHCPIPPVYGGRFFVVPREIVLADAGHLVARGVRHLTFADPDFFNGPGHSLAILRELHERHPAVTFDITTKIEHLLEYRTHLPTLASSGCVFVVSAVESLSDSVLNHLDKGHTRQDVFAAHDALREAGLALRPSLVAFTPWTTIEDYLDVLDWIESEGLTHHLDPVQTSIRLLVPPGSLLLESEALRPHLRGLDAARFSWRWEHPDPRMDRLHTEVAKIVHVAAHAADDPETTLARVRLAAERGAGAARPARRGIGGSRARPPRLTEPWFC